MRYLFLQVTDENEATFRDLENQDGEIIRRQISNQLAKEYRDIVHGSKNNFVEKLPKWHKKVKEACFGRATS